MTPRLYIIIIQIVFLSGLLFSKELEQGLVNYYPVDLSIFEGHKSLLLAWSYDDSIDAKSEDGTINLVIEVRDRRQLTRIRNRIRNINGLIYLERI